MKRFKRLLVERQFKPKTDLYEFKLFIINRKIKFVYFENYLNNTYKIYSIYDPNYNFVFRDNKLNIATINITSVFKKDALETLNKYAIILSEDFPNFIRVDLLVFHHKIYLSELTFASYNGMTMDREEKYIKKTLKNFKRIDDHY